MNTVKIQYSSSYSQRVKDEYFLEHGKQPGGFQFSTQTDSEQGAPYRKHFLGISWARDCDGHVSAPWDSQGLDEINPSPEKVYELWSQGKNAEMQKMIDDTRVYMAKYADDPKPPEISQNYHRLSKLTNLPASDDYKKLVDEEVPAFNKMGYERKELARKEEDRLRDERIQKENEALLQAAKEKEEAAAQAPGIDINGKRAILVTIPTENGATIKRGPVHGEKNWVAVITSDPKSPGGLDRQFTEPARGRFFLDISPLKVGDAIEIGANSEGRKGRTIKERWYGIVARVNENDIQLLGPMTESQATKFDISRLWELFGGDLGDLNDQQLLQNLKAERDQLTTRLSDLDTKILALELKIPSTAVPV